MGGIGSKQGYPGAGAERSEGKSRLSRFFSKAKATTPREGASRDGRAVKIMPMPAVTHVPAAARVARADPQERAGGIAWASSAELLTPARPAAQEGSDEWFQSLSPDQAAVWIRRIAQASGGADMDDSALDLLCIEIGLHATELGVAHLQAMGQALAQVFHPPAPSRASSLSAALAAPVGYQGLARLLKVLLAQPHQALRPEQAGAFVEGLRLSVPPTLAGADAVLRRAICEAALAGIPTDTVIAMSCGLFAAMVDPAAKPVSYSRAHLPALPSALPPQRRADLQDALNMGKRLALQPCSVLDKDMKGTVAERVRWLMIAYRMPRPQANEERFPPSQRNYAKAVRHLARRLSTREQAQVLAAVNKTRGLGALRAAQATTDMQAQGTPQVKPASLTEHKGERKAS